jgi:DHA3 family macrolide efflux protein-like MFS transporter
MPSILRNRNFMLLWTATLISRAGDTFTFLALAVKIDSLYADAGGSARALGMVLIAYALPQLLLSLFAGTLVDRWDRRRVMVAADVLRAGLAPAFILLQSATDVPWAAVVAFGLSSFGVFFYPARTALLPNLVDEAELITANSYLQVGETVARLSGPVLAGIVLGVWGPTTAFFVDGASFLASGLLLVGIRGVVTKVEREPGGADSTLRDLRQGVRYALGSRLLQGVTIGLALAVLGIGAVDVLFVPFMRDAFSAPPEALGLLMTAQGVGMLVGGGLMSAHGERMAPKWVAAITLATLGLGTAGLGLAPAYWATLPVMGLIGLSLTPLNASLETILQRGVPGELMGRAGSVVDMFISMAHLTSMGAAGWFGDWIGLRQTYGLASGLLVAGAIALTVLLGRAERYASATGPAGPSVSAPA